MPAASKHSVLALVTLASVAILTVAASAGGAPPWKKWWKSDRVVPSSPANVHVTAATQSSVSLEWDAATDNVRVAGYLIRATSESADGEAISVDQATALVWRPAYRLGGLPCGKSVYIHISAFDRAGNRSPVAAATVATAPCLDRQAPTPPSGFVQAATTPSSVVLTWSASYDDIGVVSYGVYRAQLPVTTTAEPKVALSGLDCGSDTEFVVDAVDAAGNRSQRRSAWVRTSACPDEQAPSSPTSLAVADRTATSLTLSWRGASDNVGVAGYRVTAPGRTSLTTPETSATLERLECNATYRLSVDAYDTAGNRSTPAEVAATTLACPSQPPAPTPPAPTPPAPTPPAPTPPAPTPPTLQPPTFVSSSIRAGTTLSGTVQWTVVARNAALVEFWANAPEARRGRRRSCSPTGSTPPACRTARMRSAWGSGGRTARVSRRQIGSVTVQQPISGPAAPPPGTTTPPAPAPDTTPPTQPAGLSVASATRTSISLAWTAATDNVGVTGYGVFANGSSVASPTQTSATVSNLACGTAYALAVDARDAAGNRSTRAGVTASTSPCADTQAPSAPTNVTATSRTATSIALSWSRRPTTSVSPGTACTRAAPRRATPRRRRTSSPG